MENSDFQMHKMLIRMAAVMMTEDEIVEKLKEQCDLYMQKKNEMASEKELHEIYIGKILPTVAIMGEKLHLPKNANIKDAMTSIKADEAFDL